MGLYLLATLFCAVIAVCIVYYGRNFILNVLFPDASTKRPFQPVETKPSNSIPIFPAPKNAVEESTFLRLLVFLLGPLAIFSLDVSLQSNFSPIAIPILSLGSVWSYQRRHHSRSIPNRIAFLVSLALTLACLFGPFLGQLRPVVEQNPAELTPFLLALTLVSLHLFRGTGLYLRKDISIAVLRSTLMVGVAAAVNTNLSFLWLLGSFLVLLFPTLVLLHRSTLQLPPSKAHHLPWQQLAQIALATICLGSILALFAPQFQLSQLGIKLPEIEQIAGKLPVPDLNGPSDESLNPNNDSEQFKQLTTAMLNSADLPTRQQLAGNSTSQTIKVYIPGQGWITLEQKDLPAPPQQLTAAQTAQLQTLQQDLETLSTQAPQLSPQELNTVQEQLTNIETQLQQQSSPAASPSPASNPTTSITPSPMPTAQLTENIAALQSTLDSLRDGRTEQLKNHPRPSASITANSPPNPQLTKLQEQLKATQSKVSEKITQAQSSPSPSTAPSKPPLTPAAEKKLQEQWITIARVVMVLLILTAGVIWYLRQQGAQERKQKAKRRQFDRLPPIEQLYRLMLKDLAKAHHLRRPPQTELEFSQLQQLRHASPIQTLIAEISADYVAWRYGARSVSTPALAEKFRRFQEMHQRELAQKASSSKKI